MTCRKISSSSIRVILCSWNDGHNEANSRFLQICEHSWKRAKPGKLSKNALLETGPFDKKVTYFQFTMFMVLLVGKRKVQTNLF